MPHSCRKALCWRLEAFLLLCCLSLGLSSSAPANTQLLPSGLQLQPSTQLMDSFSVKARGKLKNRMVTEIAAKYILRWSMVFFQFVDCCSRARKVVCDEHPPLAPAAQAQQHSGSGQHAVWLRHPRWESEMGSASQKKKKRFCSLI